MNSGMGGNCFSPAMLGVLMDDNDDDVSGYSRTLETMGRRGGELGDGGDENPVPEVVELGDEVRLPLVREGYNEERE